MIGQNATVETHTAHTLMTNSAQTANAKALIPDIAVTQTTTILSAGIAATVAQAAHN